MINMKHRERQHAQKEIQQLGPNGTLVMLELNVSTVKVGCNYEWYLRHHDHCMGAHHLSSRMTNSHVLVERCFLILLLWSRF